MSEYRVGDRVRRRGASDGDQSGTILEMRDGGTAIVEWDVVGRLPARLKALEPVRASGGELHSFVGDDCGKCGLTADEYNSQGRTYNDCTGKPPAPPAEAWTVAPAGTPPRVMFYDRETGKTTSGGESPFFGKLYGRPGESWCGAYKDGKHRVAINGRCLCEAESIGGGQEPPGGSEFQHDFGRGRPVCCKCGMSYQEFVEGRRPPCGPDKVRVGGYDLSGSSAGSSEGLSVASKHFLADDIVSENTELKRGLYDRFVEIWKKHALGLPLPGSRPTHRSDGMPVSDEKPERWSSLPVPEQARRVAISERWEVEDVPGCYDCRKLWGHRLCLTHKILFERGRLDRLERARGVLGE